MRATLVRPQKGFWGRSMEELLRLSSIAVRSEGIKGPSGPLVIQSFRDATSLEQCKLMTDSEIGGFSTAHLDWVPWSSSSSPSSSSTPGGYLRFHGHISTRLPADRPDVQRSGYAAWRTADRLPTVFGRSLWNVDSYAYLALRVRCADRRSYLINVQTDSMVAPTDLHQHRLFSRQLGGSHSPPTGRWETVFVPWSDFVRTNHGFVVEPQTELLRQRVRSVGLGLTDRRPGPFALCISRLWATNHPHEVEDETDAERADSDAAAAALDKALMSGTAASDAEAIAASPNALKNKHGQPIRWDNR